MTATISLRTCKRTLSILWFTGGMALFVLIALQSMRGLFGAKVEEAWAWFLPNLMPTLTLIIGVLVFDASASRPDRRIDRTFYHLTLALSAIYLLLVALIPLLQPFQAAPLDQMHRSSLWLGPLQGLVAAALGAFFVKGAQA